MLAGVDVAKTISLAWGGERLETPLWLMLSNCWVRRRSRLEGGERARERERGRERGSVYCSEYNNNIITSTTKIDKFWVPRVSTSTIRSRRLIPNRYYNYNNNYVTRLCVYTNTHTHNADNNNRSLHTMPYTRNNINQLLRGRPRGNFWTHHEKFVKPIHIALAYTASGYQVRRGQVPYASTLLTAHTLMLSRYPCDAINPEH